LIASCLVVFGLTFTVGLVVPPLAAPSGKLDPSSVQVSRVIDGDTLALAGGERVRIANIDTAEMPPRSQCEREAQLALKAKSRLSELVRAGGSVTLSRTGRDKDRYGRLLRTVRINGRDVGDQLVQEGLAQRWQGRRASWC
jgi:micrococcal nuclease